MNCTVDAMALDKLDRTFNAVQPTAAAVAGGDVSSVVGVPDIVNLLLTLYDPLSDYTGTLHNVNIPLTVDMVLNWLLNVYDRLAVLLRQIR